MIYVRAAATPWLVSLTVVLWVLAAGLQSNLLGWFGAVVLLGALAVARA